MKYKLFIRDNHIFNTVLIFFGRIWFIFTSRARSRRKNLNFEDYIRISKKFFVLPVSRHWDNDLYGIGHALLNYTNLNKKEINCFIEHGCTFGSYVSKNTFKHFNKTVICFGLEREIVLKKRFASAEIIKIGPYIHYSQSILNRDEIVENKKKLGKNILVFVDHSTNEIQLDHDHNSIIKEIGKVVEKNNIKTVTICMYWKDIQLGVYKHYLKAGYNIFCAGYRDDIYFLPRLRSMIEIADLTASNAVGTHVPYCIVLNKPHILLADSKLGDVKQKYMDGDGISEVEFNDRMQQINEVERVLRITSDPMILRSNELMNNIFGFDEIKTKSQLSEIILNLNR